MNKRKESSDERNGQKEKGRKKEEKENRVKKVIAKGRKRLNGEGKSE